VSSFVEGNRSLGSAIIFFLDALPIGFGRTFEKVSGTPTGNCSAGRFQDRASCFDSDVLYCTSV
jgi:hypothetical protein